MTVDVPAASRAERPLSDASVEATLTAHAAGIADFPDIPGDNDIDILYEQIDAMREEIADLERRIAACELFIRRLQWQVGGARV